MYEQPPLHRINRYGEYEVDINGKVYNLSKIMEHKPDLEHLDLILKCETISVCRRLPLSNV